MGVALVTGGSRGIGAACVRALAEAGMDVMVGYTSGEAAAAEVAAGVEALGRRAAVHGSG
jgi:3-oxoacyl-[acyl-carrier protein] reductase